jgi:hypothetical protein
LNITLAYYPLKDYPSTDFPGASLKMYPGVIFHIDTSAPSDIDTVPPKIEFLGINKETADWLFNFTVNEPITWVGYSLDNQANITIDGNFVPKELSIGNHNMMVYAKDTAGNIGAQYLGFLVDRPATLGFFIDKPDPVENSDTTDKPGTADRPNLFPTIAIVVSIATVAIVGIGILIHFKKHKPTAT